MRTSITLVLVLGAIGCKGEKVVQPDPQTLADLEQCGRDKAEKDKLIKALEEEKARI